MKNEYTSVCWDGNGFDFPVLKDGEESPHNLPLDNSYPQNLKIVEGQPVIYQNQIMMVPLSNAAGGCHVTYGNLDSACRSIMQSDDKYEAEHTYNDAVINAVVDVQKEREMDENRARRKISLVVCQDVICWQKEYEDGRLVLDRLFNGFIKFVEKMECRGKMYFRLICIVNGQESVGQYFPAFYLESNKLFQNVLFHQLTILEKKASNSYAIDFIRNWIMREYQKCKPQILTGRLGWSTGIAHFQRELPAVICADLPPVCKGFKFQLVEQVPEYEELISKTVETYRSLGKNGSVILLSSYAAMFSSLLEVGRNDAILVLQGDCYFCSKVAVHFMRSYQGAAGGNVVILSQIGKRDFDDYMRIQGDDTVIISMHGLDKSDFNKTIEIQTCAATGSFGGEHAPVLFVFCADKYLPFDIENCLLLSVEQTKGVVFDEYPQLFRSAVVQMIESDGTYWKAQATKILQEELQNAPGELSFIPTVRATKRLLVELFKTSEQTLSCLRQFVNYLENGVAEIEKILNEKTGDIMFRFKGVVEEAVNSGSLKVSDRYEDCGNEEVTARVFYDEKYYYFSQQVFDEDICHKNLIEGTALLHLKQKLQRQGYLRVYNSSSKKDYGYDFYYMRQGKFVKQSGYAIRRDFWDASTGGCSLIELTGLKEQKER